MTEMINNSCNQENDVYGEPLAADKISDLSEEQLRVVLEQLTDHNLPDSEKSPLVRRLNAENASKEESDLVITRLCKSSTAANTCRSIRKSRHLHRTGSKDAEYKDRTNGSNIKAVHSSQSLQDLMSANSDYDLHTMRAIGANSYRSGKRLNKASRANSFTMPSGSQHFCNNINVNKEGFSEVSSDSRTSSQSQTQQPLHSLKGTRNKIVKSRATHISSAKSDEESSVCDPSLSSLNLRECFATQSVYTDNHNMDSCDTNCSTLCNTSAQAVEPQICEIEMKDMRQRVRLIEYTRDLDINADCQHKAYNNVDSFVDLGLTVNSKDVIKTGVAERVVNNNCDFDPNDYNTSEDKQLIPTQGSESSKPYDPMNRYQDSDLANLHTQQPLRDPQLSRNPNNSKKKRKTDGSVKLSQHIEGHIGFKDVEYLEAFVNSSGIETTKHSTDLNSKNGTLLVNNNSSVKESVKKRDKNIQMISNSVSKRKNGSNVSSAHKNSVSPNIPLSTSSSSFSSDENNSVSKHSDFAQRTDSQNRETTSPLNSSADPKNRALSRENSDNLDDEKVSISTINSSFSLMTSNISADMLYTASDSEMADREKGFVTPKSKHFKRRKGLNRRNDNQRNHKSVSMQSSTSTTPSSSTVSGPPGYERYSIYSGMRGYESEREYTDDYRRKQNSSVCGRRKSLSSVPHSEHNSPYNSDGEMSSHSMPIRNDSLNTEKSASESRTTPSSISSTPKASYADIAKTLNFGLSSGKRSSMDSIYMTNSTLGSLSVQYQDFPQLNLSLTPVTDLSTPSSPNNSKIIEALVSPPQKVLSEKRDLTSDSYSAPTTTTNTPLPQTVQQNECLLSEPVVKDSNIDLNDTNESIDESVIPAVIMCDYTESVPLSDIGSVTFGFFDDLSVGSAKSGQNVNQTQNEIENNDSNELMTQNAIKTSPEVKSHVNSPKVSPLELTYIDVDKKSFNYEHIIGFIKKAWDNAKRDFQYECYESSPTVN